MESDPKYLKVLNNITQHLDGAVSAFVGDKKTLAAERWIEIVLELEKAFTDYYREMGRVVGGEGATLHIVKAKLKAVIEQEKEKEKRSESIAKTSAFQRVKITGMKFSKE